MTRYQVQREETYINLTNISEQVYYCKKDFPNLVFASILSAELRIHVNLDLSLSHASS